MKKSLISILLIVMLVLSLGLTACEPEEPPAPPKKDGIVEWDTHYCAYCGKCCDSACTDHNDKCSCEPLVVTHTSWTILTGTAYETAVHKYVTNKEGPAIAIVGGIHGDEVAGWKEGLALVDETGDSYIGNMYGVCGTILIIPQANILADKACSRYKVSGYTFTDLNRSFPRDRQGSPASATLKISNAIVKEVEDFNTEYNAKVIVDLHESQHSWTAQDDYSTTLGDTLIFNNEVFTMYEILERYNSAYLRQNETEFANMDANQKGSFNYYFTNTYPDKVVFTIETNRERYDSVDRMPRTTRVRQQHNVLQAMFDVMWGRI